MSVSAPNPAASPAPGSSSAAGAAGTGVAGQTAHAHGPLTGFEALLAAFFGAQGATGDGTGGTGGAGAGPFLLGKLAGKIAAGDKATGPDGKTKAGDDAKAAGADATSTAGVVPDAALTVLVPPSISALIVVPTPPTTDAASPQPGAGPALPGGSDKTAGQVVAATLAQLGAPATGGADAGKTQSAATQTALAAGAVAADATATAKVAAPTPATPAAGAATSPNPQIQPQPPVVEASVPPPPAPTAALTPPAPNTGAKAEPVAAAEAKDKTQTAKSTRVEGARVDAAAPNANTSAKTADAVQPISSGLAKGGGADRDPQGPVLNAKAQPADEAKLDGRSTRFDVQLDPAGLGKVDVRVEIGGDGKMSASMAFDNPQAAAELKSRAGELQRALEQSGFDLSGGLSFDVASDSGQGRQAQGQDTDTNTGAAFRGRAFQTALDTTADAAPGSQPMFRRSSVSGVDIRI